MNKTKLIISISLTTAISFLGIYLTVDKISKIKVEQNLITSKVSLEMETKIYKELVAGIADQANKGKKLDYNTEYFLLIDAYNRKRQELGRLDFTNIDPKNQNQTLNKKLNNYIILNKEN